jgi:ubiquinone/menaquinone biosynthesis C-methylase UbiE
MSAPTANYRNLLRRYASYAPDYDQRWAKYSRTTLRKALEAIPADGQASLLDVACGTGLLAGMLRQRHPQLRITGVDISPQMLAKAQQRIPAAPGNGVSWRLGHAEKLPVESAEFNVLTCTNAFHLVQDPHAALAEFRRALRPGGTLVLVDWCLDFPLMKVRDVVLRVFDRQRRQVRRLGELAGLLESAGFTVASRERFRTPLWGMMCVVARTGGVAQTAQRVTQAAWTRRERGLSRR